ncbi:hypothetical protein B0H17DRAFT_1133962 [Mycena rosella]|uniref:DUF6589 domain-containing protein n=1 Tax=Mycena rosella TaxID=1033263 RepID=A0AAD7DJR7_MYCRO|nr:hypothetical protein B0H17DRAFT_1133962 [Mycena rosella]
MYSPTKQFFSNTAPITPANVRMYRSGETGPITFLDIETPKSGVAPCSHGSIQLYLQLDLQLILQLGTAIYSLTAFVYLIYDRELPSSNTHINQVSANDENTPPTPSNPSQKRAKTSGTSSFPSQPQSVRQSHRFDDEKMKNVLDAIKSQGWTLGEFLYRLFRCKDEDQATRSNQHAQIVSKFFKVEGDYRPSDILTCWMTNPYGAIPANSPPSTDMYSTTTPYTAIRSVRPALTSFALQTVGEHLARGAEKVVQGSSGLHTSVKSRDAVKQLKWVRLGSDTISVVGDVIESHLAAAWYLMDPIAARNHRTRDGVKLPPRKSRPSRGVIILYQACCDVIIHALADLLFCRSSRANLLPVARGILYFGSSVPVEIMAYNCRIGTMPSYSTIYRSLEGLSTEEALVTLNHGRDPTKAGILLFDNVQNLARIRDLRIGRENHMNVGMSGLWVEASDSMDVAVFDLNDKRRFIANSQRADLTVATLLGFLKQEEADATGDLEWMEVLVRCTKPLNHYTAERQEADDSFRAQGWPARFPSAGRAAANRLYFRKLIIGGDGLSYAMVLQLQAYLQFHKDPFKSFEILEPQLQVWHTKWTDLIRIFQTHWGRVSGKSTNPASLGHSAGKIGRAAPSNMKKVEFYPGSQLVHLVLDARMLDCWRLLLGTGRRVAVSPIIGMPERKRGRIKPSCTPYCEEMDFVDAESANMVKEGLVLEQILAAFRYELLRTEYEHRDACTSLEPKVLPENAGRRDGVRITTTAGSSGNVAVEHNDGFAAMVIITIMVRNRNPVLPEPVRLIAVQHKCGEGGEQDASDQCEAFRRVKSEGISTDSAPEQEKRQKKPWRGH